MKTKILLIAFGLLFNSVTYGQAKSKVVVPVSEVTQNINLTLVKFDTQDNLFLKSFKFPNCNEWENQGGLDEGEAINQFSGRRISYKGTDAFRVRTTKKTKKVFLNNYSFFYKVQKISENEFVIISKKFNYYFDNTDIIEVLIFQ